MGPSRDPASLPSSFAFSLRQAVIPCSRRGGVECQSVISSAETGRILYTPAQITPASAGFGLHGCQEWHLHSCESRMRGPTDTHNHDDDSLLPRPRAPFLLEVCHQPSGRCWCEDLRRPRIVIGRDPTADVVLDDDSVDRFHAELVRGPYGQWLIHDLKSTGGTYVRGQPLEERLLSTGDEATIGVFSVRVRASGSTELESCDIRAPETVRVGSLLPPPPTPQRESPAVPPSSKGQRLRATHLAQASALARELTQVETPTERQLLLCNFLVRETACANAAAVVRLTGPRTARLVTGPARASDSGQGLYLPSHLTDLVWETRLPACFVEPPSESPKSGPLALVCPHLAGRGAPGERTCGQRRWLSGRSSERITRPPNHIALLSPLLIETDFVDGLFVELAPGCAAAEWCCLAGMIAAAYQQTQVIWEMRVHMQQVSGVERELQMARQIQQSLLPQRCDALAQDLDVVVGFEPCHWVGGDYTDVIPLPDGRILLTIGDVCGKGMQAALVASSLHTFVRAIVDMGLGLPELVERINRYLCRYLPNHSFVTLLAVALDPRTGELEVLSAGHPSAMLADPVGRVWSLDLGHNVGLGLMDCHFVAESYVLKPDELLFMYTDGLTEASNEHHVALGTQRLAELVSGAIAVRAGIDPAGIKEALLSGLRSHRGSRLASDDTTFLLARRRSQR